MKNCILLTGGAGFIGCSLSHLIAATSSLPIVVIDCLHPQVHAERERPAELHGDALLVVADICEPATWTSFLSTWRPSIVVHLAAETGTGQSLNEASRHTHVNVTGTARMLDAFAAANHTPQRLVLSSSRAVYGEGVWLLSDETSVSPGQRSKEMLEAGQWDFADATAMPFEAGSTPAQPTSVYGATKLAQEQIMRCWALSFGAQIVIMRLQNVYGPGQSLDNPYTGIVSLFSRLARSGESIPLYEDGLMRRDFIFISDVGRALHSAMFEDRADGNIYDIGYGKPTTIADVANLIIEYYGAPAPHVCGKYRNGDVRHASCDVARAGEIGWQPNVALSDGVAALCAWIDQRLETV